MTKRLDFTKSLVYVWYLLCALRTCHTLYNLTYTYNYTSTGNRDDLIGLSLTHVIDDIIFLYEIRQSPSNVWDRVDAVCSKPVFTTFSCLRCTSVKSKRCLDVLLFFVLSQVWSRMCGTETWAKNLFDSPNQSRFKTKRSNAELPSRVFCLHLPTLS